MRAYRTFYTHSIVAACRDKSVRFAITIHQHQSRRNITEVTPEAGLMPIPYCMDGAADLAETAYMPFRHEPDAKPVRLTVLGVKHKPCPQLALFDDYSYHACITDRHVSAMEREADHRRHAEAENTIHEPASSASQDMKTACS